jgi:hypothetical protein
VQEAHDPTDAKQRYYETSEAVRTVAKPFSIGSLGHESENDAAKQSKQKSCLKVI